MALMRDLKERSGLTYRQLEERAAERGEVLARSTLADALTGRTAPRPELLTAFVRACGEEDRLHMWLAAREQAVGSQRADTGGPGLLRDAPPGKAAGRRVAAVATAAALLGGVGVWLVTASGGEPAGDGIVRGAESVSPAPGADPLSGWVRIRPATAPGLCLTDGRVRDRRYTPLVAVQRPCDRVAPQGTLLEPVGGNAYRIQWHHPDYGKGCLRVLPGEPVRDCWSPTTTAPGAAASTSSPPGPGEAADTSSAWTATGAWASGDPTPPKGPRPPWSAARGRAARCSPSNPRGDGAAAVTPEP
ncbi:helix-turn-helix transcriptional regulator [Streptomyces sp. MRC013]|uniref:helix-turn-helix domain-containing protein n=1 Tax=Streptomyces sp. MRC013 TaxID=2898276 RepID=UPI0020271C31|nr:helix-turn-helix transcriptional regulator [Streptomyces sp. MRC013]URM90463.1 helix-turn-helix transcriptional regulator [Streptomyces sp. MRC013]